MSAALTVTSSLKASRRVNGLPPSCPAGRASKRAVSGSTAPPAAASGGWPPPFQQVNPASSAWTQLCRPHPV